MCIYHIDYKICINHIWFKMHTIDLKACTVTSWKLVLLSHGVPLKMMPVDASVFDNYH